MSHNRKKTPLINTKGNFTKFEIIITVDGISVGGYDDNTTLNAAKQNAANIMPSTNIIGWMIWIPITSPMPIGTNPMQNPNTKDASTSPTNIAQMATGAANNRSNVRCRASKGTIAGPIDMDEK
jgi:hypothetical protein